jgi:MFS family permease
MKKRKKWIFMVPAAILGMALFIGLGGWLVTYLWNWLLPPLFGWRMITFWQALALLVLCRILVGGFGMHGGHRSSFRRRMHERWEGMTPEEREKFREAMRQRCGDFGPPSDAPKA